MRYVSFSYFTLLTVQYVIQYIAAGSSPLLPGPLSGPRSIALQFPQNKKVRINVFQQSHIPEVRTNAFLNVIKMRGGDLQMRIDAFDLGRERIRLEAMSSYGVMTALIMGAALRLYSHVSPPKNSDTKRFDTSSYIIFLISCSICVLSGAYTTLTFSLLSIYSKTALGMANDTAYLQFLEKTSIYRKIGFETFSRESLVLFSILPCVGNNQNTSIELCE